MPQYIKVTLSGGHEAYVNISLARAVIPLKTGGSRIEFDHLHWLAAEEDGVSIIAKTAASDGS